MSGRQYEGTPLEVVYDSEAPDYAGHSGAHTWSWREYGYEKIVIMDERGTEIAATHRRDHARLIAAAPDMLEALTEMVMAAEGAGLDAKARRKRALAAGLVAIAKAEGRNNG